MVAEATHGLLLTGGLVTVLVAVVLCTLAKPEAVLWADRTTTSSLACMFTVPLLAGVVAIVTGARMGGLSEVAATSPAGARFPARVVWLAGLFWAGVVTLAQVMAPVVAHSPWGSPFSATMVLPWIQTAVSLAGAVSLGVLAGCRWHGWPVGPLVAAPVFLWCYLTTYLPGRWNLIAAFDNGTFYQPWLEPAPRVITGHTLVALAVVLVTAGVLWPGLRRARVSAGIAAVVAVAGIVLIATSGTDRARPRELTAPPACATARSVTYCTWPALADHAPHVATALASARNTVDGYWNTPTEFTQAGLPWAIPGKRMDIALPIQQETLASDALFAVLPTCSADPAGLQAQGELMTWATAKAGFDQASDSPYVKLAHSSSAAQHQWVAQQMASGGCQ
ncbi:hypothetical protein GCM10009638_13390 [Luteococcus sanguinis]